MNKKILSLLVVLLSGFAFAACGIDEAWITPESKIVKNDTVAARHDKEVAADDAPAKVQLTLAGGHFHGVAFHQDADAKGILYKKRCSTSHSCAKATNGNSQKAATLCFA